jgi:hypothetical protein
VKTRSAPPFSVCILLDDTRFVDQQIRQLDDIGRDPPRFAL